MWKFIIILILIFGAFYFGGTLLLDSGIADAKGVSRFPVAVQTEKVIKQIYGVADGAFGQIYVVVVPVFNEVSKTFNGQGF